MRGYYDFILNFCSLILPKNIVTEPLCVQGFLGDEKIYPYTGGYFEKILHLTVPKLFVEELFCDSEELRYPKKKYG